VDDESKKKPPLHCSWDFQSQSALGTFCSKFCMANVPANSSTVAVMELSDMAEEKIPHSFRNFQQPCPFSLCMKAQAHCS
jgi:hypothetical protein